MRIIIQCPESDSPLRGRIHLRGPSLRSTSILLQSGGGPYIINSWEEPRGRQQKEGYSLSAAVLIASLGNFRVYALVKETRTSQKIINISGRMLRRKSMPVLRNKAGNICWRARNMDDAAMNNAKHMRQRCRAIRCIPEILPRTSMRMSPTTDSQATEPRKT